MTGRRLSAEQQGYVEKAAPVIRACISAFVLENPDLRDLTKRCDLEAAAEQIEGVTLKRLGREQDLDPRIIRKRVNRAIDRLREAEKDLP